LAQGLRAIDLLKVGRVLGDESTLAKVLYVLLETFLPHKGFHITHELVTWDALQRVHNPIVRVALVDLTSAMTGRCMSLSGNVPTAGFRVIAARELLLVIFRVYLLGFQVDVEIDMFSGVKSMLQLLIGDALGLGSTAIVSSCSYPLA
jgi:hypothetical protein